MRALGMAVVAAVVALAGCAGDKAVRKGEPRDPQVDAQGNLVAPGGGARYVDADLGFEVTRPAGGWTMDVTNDLTPDGIATPVVMRNEETGAQVVIQVAPAVASPVQLAERLTEGMRSQPGFTTSDPEPLELSEGAVGFRFAMGDRVLGRVAVREGAEGRVLMLLATWPTGAPEAAPAGVDQVFQSILPVQGGQDARASLQPKR